MYILEVRVQEMLIRRDEKPLMGYSLKQLFSIFSAQV